MKRLLPLLAAIVLFTSGAVAETITASVLCTPGDVVNIRESPSKKSAVVGRFECGYTFETDGETRKDNQGRKWVHMVNARLEVDEAWIIETYVQYSAVTIEKLTAVVDKGKTAMRNAPAGKRIKWMKKGSQVNVLAYSDEWAVTDQGYIAINCLVF